MSPSIPITEIINSLEPNETTLERISHRQIPLPKIAIVEYDPTWPNQFEIHRQRISQAIPNAIISITHIGSTSIPNCPAKPIIDIDLIIRDITNESTYIPQLESAGYLLLLREPDWYQHRFIVHNRQDMFPVNIHVFPMGCAHAERHLIFRDWVRGHEEDKREYGVVKRAAAKAAVEGGESMMEYTARKDEVIAGILKKAYKDLGYI
jgi:GrpB-like predicted nucleotidyltransferase (UPF0157 family)